LINDGLIRIGGATKFILAQKRRSAQRANLDFNAKTQKVKT
jgi:hypothetical protein